MTDDGVRMYLRDIGQYPLLVAEQEAPLGRAIQEGILVDGAQTLVRSLGKRVIGTELIEEGKQFIEALKSDQSTTAPDKILQAKSPYLAALNFVVRASLTPVVHEREVQAKISAMESAKHELTVTNLRLVVSIAKRYQGNGVDLLDLIQEGNIGLTTAVRKFDSEMGFKFSTYATWWIRQAIQRGLSDQSTTIRVPIHAKEKYFSALRAADNDATKLSREMRSIHSLSRPVALDQPVGENGDTALIDLIADSTDGPEYNAVSLVSTTELGADLALLRKNIAYVLDQRFGLTDGVPKTLEEVGMLMGVSRERVRQLESKGILLLRHLHDDRVQDATKKESALDNRGKQAYNNTQVTHVSTVGASDLGKPNKEDLLYGRQKNHR